MKVRVLNPFRDKDNFLKEYLTGTIIEVDDERGENLLSRQLVEVFEETPVEKVEEKVAEETPIIEDSPEAVVEETVTEKKVRKPRKVEV